MSDNWSNDIETVLEDIRINSIILSKEHKKVYIRLKNRLQFFRLPVIIISAFSSVISVACQPYIDQKYISLTTCGLALVTGIIGSIELYYGLQRKMELELQTSTDLHTLSTTIFKTTSLDPENRGIGGKTFLDDCYSQYVRLVENSGVLARKIDDKLAPLSEMEKIRSDSSDSTESSNKV